MRSQIRFWWFQWNFLFFMRFQRTNFRQKMAKNEVSIWHDRLIRIMIQGPHHGNFHDYYLNTRILGLLMTKISRYELMGFNDPDIWFRNIFTKETGFSFFMAVFVAFSAKSSIFGAVAWKRQLAQMLVRISPGKMMLAAATKPHADSFIFFLAKLTLSTF